MEPPKISGEITTTDQSFFFNILSWKHPTSDQKLVGSSQSSTLYFLFLVIFLLIPLNNQNQVSKREKTQRESSLLHNNNDSSIKSTITKLCQIKKGLESVSCSLQQQRRVKHYVTMPTYRWIHDKSMRAHILRSYEYL